MDPLAVEEAAGEADVAQLERSGRQHLAPETDEQLRAAAPDVAQQQAAVEDRHGLEHPEVDEPRLLDARDDVDVDPGLRPGPVDEHVTIVRLAHRRRGHGGDRRVVDRGHLAEPVEGLDGPVHRVVGQLGHVAGAGPEPHDRLLPLQHLESGHTVHGRHPRDDAVDRVRADVDGREGLRRRGDVSGHGGQSRGTRG
jgi:hypothetical protein